MTSDQTVEDRHIGAEAVNHPHPRTSTSMDTTAAHPNDSAPTRTSKTQGTFWASDLRNCFSVTYFTAIATAYF